MEQQDIMSYLTWNELAQVEEYLDCSMEEWANIKTKSKLVFAMQFMMAKRNNPELTFDQAEKMPIKELTELSGMELVDSPKGVTQP